MAYKAIAKPGKTTKKSTMSGTTKFSKETYIKWYKDMLLIRRFEEKVGQLYIQQNLVDSVICTLDRRRLLQERFLLQDHQIAI